MFAYQARPHTFRFNIGQPLEFPAKCELVFHFQPGQPFGTEAGGGRTVVGGGKVSISFDANRGRHAYRSEKPLSPLEVVLKDDVREVRLSGAKLSIIQHFESLEQMEYILESIYFVFPAVLNVPFVDAPYIARVDGTVGDHRFAWELRHWVTPLETTTQEDQQNRFAMAWDRFGSSLPSRLVAALHYFHTASILTRAASRPGQFVAEEILNMTKSLEVLFPHPGDGKTREAVRAGLRSLRRCQTT